MKDLLLNYARYNAWANNLLIEVLLKLENEQVEHEIISSFPSIKSTVLHIMSAENIWLQRLTLVEQPIWVAANYNGAFSEICNSWQKASAKLINFVENQTDDSSLTQFFKFYDLKKNPNEMQVCIVLQHVFNHSTSHRGQLITLLRQAGIKEIPATDFIAFVRLKLGK